MLLKKYKWYGAVDPLRDTTHDAVFPVDVIADLERLPVMNVMRVKQ